MHDSEFHVTKKFIKQICYKALEEKDLLIRTIDEKVRKREYVLNYNTQTIVIFNVNIYRTVDESYMRTIKDYFKYKRNLIINIHPDLDSNFWVVELEPTPDKDKE